MADDMVKINKQSDPSDGMVHCSDGEHYPYGTSVNFSDDMVDSLGVDKLAVGDVVEVRGYAFVDSRYEHTDTEKARKSISFQFTSIKVSREQDDRAKMLYGPD